MQPIWLIDNLTHDLDRALHYTMLWGLEGIEVGALGRATDRIPNVDEARLRRRIEEHDLTVAAVTPGLFEGPVSERAVWMNELLELEETLSFCGRIGCPLVLVSALSDGGAPEAVEVLRKAGDAAAAHNITLCVPNEAAGAYSTGKALAAMLAQVDHPGVRAAWQPAAALEAGEDPASGLDALAQNVALVRCADRTREAGRWHPAPLGEGELDYEAQFEQLRYKGFDGPVSLLVDLEPKPKYGLRAATRLLEMLRV